MVLITVLLLPLAAATAQTISIDDPAGDGLKGRKLDITSVKVANRDHSIVTRVSFVRAAVGDLAIYYGARGDRRTDVARVVSVHRPRGTTNTFETVDGAQPCTRLSVTWNHDNDTVTVRLPSRCFRAGNYGAVHVRVITEIGSDADIAPKNSAGGWRWTRWVRRG